MLAMTLDTAEANMMLVVESSPSGCPAVCVWVGVIGRLCLNTFVGG